ncbi:MAG: ABC transporter permease [Candidatus Lambdaproteobacteria bacterium RIFOXYD1_FULL_56_27]|uniref:ABC transporter permease n=1 Tax=Candidatus Lambdaproteobacteria bacterium RIFOXYD2_FULL_56_26 TaxID=1817773 RepID=A0A1F6GQB7_9PROT|nr:MAG: ABC transporter permease [Candidatus Lambdaproteobacteria bacterium RIFOXYD2_FULL_56_26]OGH03733.1 MAG: ABC transporter permease [Candidatus Lambdaproteobacteria bacterium RIFOXYC1_FULL_56_13]OGH07317.1 MAG: ABC transporter permease [Candidatus Lambdaproteobacteria bacterium RIFOXYD1_FULL_56_27]
MKAAQALYKKELVGYFQSPVAYVFLIVFLLSTVGTTFFLGRFFESGQASLEIFFLFHPWLYLFLVPAAGMGLWAEERSQGTLEILFTLPISLWGAVTAKFLAAWSFLGIALALTFPMVLTLWYLGSPDNGVMLAGYLGSFLMAGAYLAVSSLTSALTRNQVISFILSVILCFGLVLAGWGVFMEILSGFLPQSVTEWISNFSFTTHFQSLLRGVIDLGDLTYFFSLILAGLWTTGLVLDFKRGRD